MVSWIVLIKPLLLLVDHFGPICVTIKLTVEATGIEKVKLNRFISTFLSKKLIYVEIMFTWSILIIEARSEEMRMPLQRLEPSSVRSAVNPWTLERRCRNTGTEPLKKNQFFSKNAILGHVLPRFFYASVSFSPTPFFKQKC